MSDWFYFNNSCFKLFKEELNEFDAQKSCTSIKSTLTSTYSAEENKFVHQLPVLTSYAWIGLFNLNSTHHSYEWVDGSMVDFRNWDDGEPNNYLGLGENYT